MWIKRIKVEKLYGLHNYDILFDANECVKIIHAPNGFGKTTILKMIRAIIEGHLSEIKKVPFKMFELEFNEKTGIKVTRQKDSITYEITLENETERYVIEEAEDVEEAEENLAELLKPISIPVYFIDASRLWIEEKSHRGENGRMLMPAVMEYARELGGWMRQAMAQSNFCGQELDRSFPARMLQMINDEKAVYFNEEEVKQELSKLEKQRSFLEGAGLFTEEKEPVLSEISHLEEPVLKVLTLYIKDSKEKLKAFDGLATKINLLCRLINKNFSYKKMEVNMNDGYVFKVPTSEKLQADQLSSGEQNELILMFMLLFKAPPHALILMDEPEISLHIAWQQSFLEDMQAIASLSQIRMMIATHSPDIINGRWDLTTGLEEE